MTFPLFELGAFGDRGALLFAVAIGVAFGWFLERAGLGNARKLAAQFYLTDMTVLKVLFTAIVTAGLGVFWLTRLGWLDLGLVHLPETFLLPQLAGGVVFGAGFVIGGLCPGTSCVAAATGRLDGLALVLGMFAGVFVFAEAFPLVGSFYDSTAVGTRTLPQTFGLPYGATLFLVVVVALAAFAAAERIERRHSR